LALFLILILISPHDFLYMDSSAAGGLSYVPINISNNQSKPTSTPFQVSITFNPSLYTPYESASLGNIRFYDSFDGSLFSSELNAWIESFSGSTTPNLATSATVWIDIPGGIGAYSNVTIYMVFESSSIQFDGIYLGESPSISSTYGQYDNGAHVFSIYCNGSNLLATSHTGTGGSGPSAIASAPSPYFHAITGSVSGGGSAASTWTINGETSTQLPTAYVVQMLVYLSGSTPLTDLMTNVQSISSGPFYVFRYDARGGSHDLIGNYASGSTSTNIISQSSATSLAGTWYQMTAVDSSDSLSLYKSTSWNLGSFGALESGPVSGMGYTGGGIAVTTDGASSTEYWTMIVVRSYPPNGVMPSSSFGAVSTAAPSAPYGTIFGKSSASVESPLIALETTTSATFVPITIRNTQTVPTLSGLQISLNINFNTYRSYLISDAGNIRFFNSSTFTSIYELPAWLESYSGNTSSSAYTATSSRVWLCLRGTIIPASSAITIYMVFESASDFDGIYWGEAPALSPAFGQFDNGANVFTYYNSAPSGTSGWTIHGLSGQTSSAPLGSYFKTTRAYYANSANGDYMYSRIPNLATNEVITFWVYTSGLGNLFFLGNSAGSGQMARLDSRGGGNWAGLATATSWTSWNAPSSGLDKSPNNWYKFDVVMNSTIATLYIGASSNNISALGTLANKLTVSNNGNYLGLVGDALGATYVTYWNGFIVRYYPSAGIFPTISFGSPVASAITENVMPQQNEGSVQFASGLTFYESASSPATCTSPQIDTNFSKPSSSSSFTLNRGNSACLWSPEFVNASMLTTGSWIIDLWAAAASSGTLQISVYGTNSTGSILSTIIASGNTNTIGFSKTQVRTIFSGAGSEIVSNGFIEVVITAPAAGPSSFTIYWGNTQLTNFQSPTLFNNVLAINNTSTSPWLANLAVSGSSNAGRLGNMTVWFSSQASPQVTIGSLVPMQQTTGTQVQIPALTTVYISLNATATSFGSSSVSVSLKLQSFSGGPYAQYSVIFETD
jgi:hypothetical protein